MHPEQRVLFNAAFSDAVYAEFMRRFEAKVGPVPFRVAETPLFLTHALRDRLARHAVEIVDQLSEPARLARLKQAIPARYDTPGMDPLPNCVQVDFALVDGPDGMDGRVVELQAFPSLYALMTVKAETWFETLRALPGLEGDWRWALDGDHAAALDLMRRTIVAGEDPVHVALVDIDPANQKTAPDFVATRQLFGVESACVTQLLKRGRRLYRRRDDGTEVQVRRIYNRMVFDELEVKKAAVPFAWGDDLDVTWCSHPNWYWVWSKFSLPHLDHPAVPKARFLDEVSDPGDLAQQVLKPLFSFAGAGVKVDVTAEDLAAVPADQRHGWVLQDKIRYADAVRMPDGAGVKAEVRIMLLREPGGGRLHPVIALVRLSRGKMLGVDFNKGLTWVGGSVGIWRR